MTKNNSPTSISPSVHITVLTIATLLILSLLILIIGPSRILSDSSPSSNCPQIYITNPQPSPPSTSSSLSSSHQKPWDATHLRLYNDSQTLLATHKSAQYPLSWESMLIPTKHGGLIINESTMGHLDKYPDEPAQNTRKLTAAITMFHQMHCLITLRSLIFKENSMDHEHEHGPGEHYLNEHTAHCFEYLAQLIMCAADDAIEKPKKILRDGVAWWDVDGVGAVHQCKDPRPLWEMFHRSEETPVDMSRWRDGIGVREYFWDQLKDGYRYEMPDIWTSGVIGSL
ncbi:hypothetical protein BJX68DRAFT_16959 [Aspergillus pseudodeflectus]|uniref:Tat pathway signal sequence n=1 Tax=Aspergillus pseudodeflectus TaxID=176178 RepID=A0ABR4LC86_9EURO